jgi:hypothetical protein
MKIDFVVDRKENVTTNKEENVIEIKNISIRPFMLSSAFYNGQAFYIYYHVIVLDVGYIYDSSHEGP